MCDRGVGALDNARTNVASCDAFVRAMGRERPRPRCRQAPTRQDRLWGRITSRSMASRTARQACDAWDSEQIRAADRHAADAELVPVANALSLFVFVPIRIGKVAAP